MAAIANYGELRMALSDWIGHRNVATVLPRLVQTAESRLNRELRTRYQLTSGTFTFASGTANLPSDFLEMSDVFGLNGFQYRSGPVSDAQRVGSQYARYSIAGNVITINGYSGSRTYNYYAALPTLTTSSATTNWLLTRYPDVYLYAVGLEAAKYLQDDNLAARSQQELNEALRSLRADDERARWANGGVRVASLTP